MFLYNYKAFLSFQFFNCMIDRGKQNCFWTLFPDSIDFGSDLSNEKNESIEAFMKKYF